MTSTVPARASRISSPSLNSARLKAGRIRWLQPSSEVIDKGMPSTLLTGPRPPDGNQPSSTAKAMINSRPTQNVGTLNPSTDRPMMNLEEMASGR